MTALKSYAGGALFVLVLPCLLVIWAAEAEANVRLPIYGNPLIGAAFALSGLALIGSGLWQTGPVVNNLCYWVPHPIHTGLVALCLGASMIAGSAAGLWLVTPTVTLACVALVLSRGGRNPLALLPPDDERRPSTWDGVRFVVIVVIPWLALFEFTTHMGLVGTAFRFPFEDHLPVYAWTAIVYETSYLTVTFAPTWTRTNRQLRQLMITAWVAMAVVYPIYWFVPSAAPRRTMVDESWIAHLLYQERSSLLPTAAFPSFHVLWAIFVGRLWPRWFGVAYSVIIAISCVTTGMHYVPDVLAAFAISPFLLDPGRLLWRPLLRLTERVAPSRAVPHALCAAGAVLIPLATMSAVVRPGHEVEVMVGGLAGLIGKTLSRQKAPFYGGLLGVAMTCAFFEDRWMLWGGCCLGAPWMRAIGRLRQVSRDNNPFYFILCNVFLGLVVMRMWIYGCPLALICGVYVIGAGLAHFAEEAEPQTSIAVGLGFHQWMAIAAMVAGAVVTSLASPDAPALMFGAPGLWCAAGLTWIAGPTYGLVR